MNDRGACTPGAVQPPKATELLGVDRGPGRAAGRGSVVSGGQARTWVQGSQGPGWRWGAVSVCSTGTTCSPHGPRPSSGVGHPAPQPHSSSQTALQGQLPAATQQRHPQRGHSCRQPRHPAAMLRKLPRACSPFRPRGRASRSCWGSSLTSWSAPAAPGRGRTASMLGPALRG